MNIEASPLAIRPLLEMSEPNAWVLLREGEFEIRTEERAISGSGRLSLRWVPTARLIAEIETDYLGPSDIGTLNAVELTTEGAILEGAEIRGWTYRETGMRFEVHAFAVNLGIDSPTVDFLTVHIANLPSLASGTYIRNESATKAWTGRCVFDALGWQFTLDEVEDHKALVTQLNARGGFAITHTCRLQRVDGKPFAYGDVDGILGGLGFLLALVRGAWSGRIGIFGSSHGVVVWERWDVLTHSDPWTTPSHWWHVTTRRIFDELAQPVLKNVVDDDDSVARYAISWYADANRAQRSIDTALILTQTALELLAWHVAVRRDQTFSAEEFDRLRAEDRIRYLLSLAKIDSSFTDRYTDLVEFAKARGWVDLAQAISSVRNTLIHPPRKNLPIERVPAEIRIEVSERALWALELALLYLFDYQGDFANRYRDFQPPERVPWSRGDPGGAHPPWRDDEAKDKARDAKTEDRIPPR